MYKFIVGLDDYLENLTIVLVTMKHTVGSISDELILDLLGKLRCLIYKVCLNDLHICVSLGLFDQELCKICVNL